MRPIPHDPAFDSTLALWREGYDFISSRCDRLGSDVFSTRLMLRRAICARGADAARMFYDGDRFTRHGAMPQITLRLLQDKGSVQQLDGAAHQHRKAMFLSMLLAPEQIERLTADFRREWLAAIEGWERRGEISLFEEANLVLTRAVLAWVGLPQELAHAPQLCREIGGMIENAGRFGPRAWVALLTRRWIERLARKRIREVRDGSLPLAETAPLRIIAEHCDESGDRLGVNDAAVEFINLLRPVVAVGRYIVFSAMALRSQPHWREKFSGGDESELEAFVEEVRRLYPFFPLIGGRARRSFDWQDHAIQKGDWVLLDLHGTNHDPRHFPAPDKFRPGRGISWKDQGFYFIPQGGGEAATTHRCPGEAITVALMKEAVRLLTRSLSYDVPPQDLSLDLSSMPARPSSGFRIRDIVRRRAKP
jgi:fatty-acid peroxygenase